MRRARRGRAWALVIVSFGWREPGVAGVTGTANLARMECRAERRELRPELDPYQIDRFVVSPVMRIRARERDVVASWAEHRGLQVRESGPHPAVELVAPLWPETGDELHLAGEVETARPTRMTVEWTDARCPELGAPACRVEHSVRPGRSRVELRLQGAQPPLRDLRLGFAKGFRELTIAWLAAEPSFTVVTAWSPQARGELIGAHELEVSDTEEGLRIRPVEGAADPHLALRFPPVDAQHLQNLLLRIDGLAAAPVDIYFAGDACGEFSEDCRGRALPASTAGVWTAETRVWPNWTGRIDRLRLDFDPPVRGVGTLERVAFMPAPMLRKALGETRVVPAAARLPDGLWGYPLHLGERLTCRFPSPVVTPPAELRYRVGRDPDAMTLPRARVGWRAAAASSPAAAASSDLDASGRWERLALPPPGGADELVVDLECGRNCSSLAEPQLEVDVAIPAYRTAAAADSRPNFILVSLDTLRADRLETYGYGKPTAPNLAAWAGRGLVYERVYAVDTWTTPTHAAMFTGRYPTDGGARGYEVLAPGAETLAAVLGRHGYRTEAYTDAGLVRPETGLDQGFDVFVSAHQDVARKFAAAAARALELAQEAEPFFLLLHTYGAHEPYALPATPDDHGVFLARVAGTVPLATRELERLTVLLAGRPDIRAEARGFVDAVYDAAISEVDRALGGFLDALASAGILRNTVVAITADHGQELLEDGRLGHGFQLPRPAIQHVPLLVVGRGVSPGRLARVTSQVEIPRLLFATLGLTWPLEPDPCLEDELAGAVATNGYLREFPLERFVSTAVFGASCMHLRVTARDDGATVRDEATPLRPGADCTAERAGAARVHACLRQQLATAHPASPPAPVLERLRALGYVGDW